MTPDSNKHTQKKTQKTAEESSFLGRSSYSLRKHAYSKYWNFTTKNWKFSDKNSDIYHISAQNIDCGYSLERVPTIYVFWVEIRKIMYTPVNPSFTI